LGIFRGLWTPFDYQTGLSIAILRGYTESADPVVAKARQLLELMRTESMTVSEAAHSVGIPLDVLESLARLVREARGLSVEQVSTSRILPKASAKAASLKFNEVC